MPYFHADSQDPCEKDRRNAERNFSFQEFIYHAVTCRIPAYSISFYVLLCFPLFLNLKNILTVNKYNVYKIYDFSSYFNRGSMALPTLKVLWKFEELKALNSVYHICIGICLWSYILSLLVLLVSAYTLAVQEK